MLKSNGFIAKIKSPSEIAEYLEKVRADIGTETVPCIVQCSGCFDLLHPDHITHLEEASRFGNYLVVSVNSDESIARLKGVGRPIIPLFGRLHMLAALRCVDVVTWFEEDEPSRIIEEIKPDIYVKAIDSIGRPMPELAIVFKYGALRCTSVGDIHTTTLIERIREENHVKDTDTVVGGEPLPGAVPVDKPPARKKRTRSKNT